MVVSSIFVSYDIFLEERIGIRGPADPCFLWYFLHFMPFGFCYVTICFEDRVVVFLPFLTMQCARDKFERYYLHEVLLKSNKEMKEEDEQGW